MNKNKKYKIAIVSPTPFYYHAPLYRRLTQDPEINLMVYYCSDETLQGYDVIKMYNTTGKFLDKKILEGYQYEFLKNYSPTPSYFKWPFGLMNFGIWKEIGRGGYDAVILQAWTNITWVLAFLACIIHRKKVFFMTDSNIAADYTMSPFKKFIKKFLLNNFFKHASGFLTSGTANSNFYKYYGVPDNQLRRFSFSWGYEEILSKAMDLNEKKKEIRRALGIGNEELVILYVGRFSKEKSLETLLNAYEEISNDKKRLFLVGDGPLMPEIEKLVNEKNIEGVRLFGFQLREEVFKFYAASDILVLPSAQETWGIVINEAMCFNVPVIASDQVGAAIDLVKDGKNGFIFPAKNKEALKKCIENLASLSLKERESFGQESKEIIQQWINSVDPGKQIISLLN